VVGRNQNIFEEVNLKYCVENNIDISRRISGGGTVFHDLGNINWSFITAFSMQKVNNYDWAAGQIMDFLSQYNLSPYLTSRNAIEINNLKLSGQAQFTNRKNILSHGTLLIDTDLSFMQPSIEIGNEKDIQSKASKSVRSVTKNLANMLNQNIQAKEVMHDLANFISNEKVDFDLSDFDANQLKHDQWIYSRSPKFTVKHDVLGEELIFTVVKGKIESIANKKGFQINESPLINMFYKDYLFK